MTENRTTEVMVHVDQLAAAAHDAAVVDVREPAEFMQGHVRGALLMPMTNWRAGCPSWIPATRCT